MESKLCVSCGRNEGTPRRLFPQEINPEFPRGKILICTECIALMPVNYFRLVEISSLYVSAVNVQGNTILVRQSCIPELVRQIISSLWKRSTAPTYADICEILNLAQIDAPTGTEWTISKLFSFLRKEGINKDDVYAESKINGVDDGRTVELLMQKMRMLPEGVFTTGTTPAPPQRPMNAQTPKDDDHSLTVTYLRQMPGWNETEPSTEVGKPTDEPTQFLPTADELERVLREWEEDGKK